MKGIIPQKGEHLLNNWFHPRDTINGIADRHTCHKNPEP